jgi:hypothetical protein
MRESVLRTVAFHEAGHAAAWCNGLKLKTATIVPTVDASGSAASITGRLRVGDYFPKGSMQLTRERHYEI